MMVFYGLWLDVKRKKRKITYILCKSNKLTVCSCHVTYATTECGFTLKRVRDMKRAYSQMHCTDELSLTGRDT